MNLYIIYKHSNFWLTSFKIVYQDKAESRANFSRCSIRFDVCKIYFLCPLSWTLCHNVIRSACLLPYFGTSSCHSLQAVLRRTLKYILLFSVSKTLYLPTVSLTYFANERLLAIAVEAVQMWFHMITAIQI